MEKPNKALSGHATPGGWLRAALLSGLALGLMLGCGGANSKPAAPTITLVNPNFGSYPTPTATPITVTGSGFVSGVTSLNIYIGNVITTGVVLSSDTSFTFLLPAAAATAPITVVTDGGTAAYATDFVVWPKVESVVATGTAGSSPAGVPGSNVTINGWGLMGVNAVLFGTPNPTTIPSTSFTLDTANAIAFKVPDPFPAGSTSFSLQQDNGLTATNPLVVNFTVN
jgi:hypothetical protein